MTREAEEQLFDFCVRQREHFSPSEWLCFGWVPKDVLGTTALFLAGTAWYGHHDALLRVARQLAGVGLESFPDLVKRTKFDCPRFSSMLKARLRHEHAHS
jgi:hypothetical protein